MCADDAGVVSNFAQRTGEDDVNFRRSTRGVSAGVVGEARDPPDAHEG